MRQERSGGPDPRGTGESHAARRLTIGARLRAYLFAGIIVAAPIGITFYVVWQVIGYFDDVVNAVIPTRYNPETYMPFSVPGIGLLIMLGFLVAVGWFAAGLVGRTVMRTGEWVLDRMPVVRSIYGTLKQLFETVLAQKSRAFREVVLIEFPRPGSWALGFVTGTANPVVQDVASEPLVNVLVPMSPFPSSGFLLFVPSRELVHLDLSIDEGMKMVISGGIVGPPIPAGEIADELPRAEVQRGTRSLEEMEKQP